MSERVTFADLRKALAEGWRAWIRAGSVPANELECFRNLATILARSHRALWLRRECVSPPRMTNSCALPLAPSI
jgi:hypothetical protein